jgi:hypothetical protein
MKSLIEYITDITGEDQEATMKPMRIMAEQTGQDEALWNTEQDRWSRKAKNPLRVNEVSTGDEPTWEKGEMAIYGSDEVEVSIPNGPNGTVGIVFEGKTKMVLSNKLTKIDEGVMGGMQPLNPLNRMMQLAGISAPSVIGQSEVIDEPAELTEAADPFFSMYQQNLNKYKDKASPEVAANLATIESVLVLLKTRIDALEETLPADIKTKIWPTLRPIIGIGANLQPVIDKLPAKETQA